MANPDHVQLLRQGSEAWNLWREENPSVKPDLSHLNFESIREICVTGPDLSWYNLSSVDLRMSSIRNAALANASFENAYMVSVDLCFGYFGHCNFRGAKLRLSRLGSAEFDNCDFTGGDLAYCTAEETKFTGSVLAMVNMQRMHLVATDFSEASLHGALVYGISAWDLNLSGATQQDLIITPSEGAFITVDDLELAQFVYLLLHNRKLRNVIDTITSKVVLILGRFTPERKPILDALRAHLRGHDLVPILFDFERPTSRSFIETASTIAHMARFIVADFTDQGDVRREVQHIAGTLQSVPIVPMLHSGESAIPITLQDLANHPCILPVVRYASVDELLDSLEGSVIDPALAVERKLRQTRTELKERAANRSRRRLESPPPYQRGYGRGVLQRRKMKNTELSELLLVRLYDLAESEGHFKMYALNDIAAEFGVIDKGKVFNLAKALEGRGLLQGAFTSGPAVSASITGEGALFVEQGGNTGIIRNYRDHPQSFTVSIDQSTHFHSVVANSNIAVNSSETTQNLKQSSEISSLLTAVEAELRSDTTLDAGQREEALSDVAVLRSELSRKQPRKPLVGSILATLGDVSSITSLLMQLQPLLQSLRWLSG